jgi:hypothetical protein
MRCRVFPSSRRAATALRGALGLLLLASAIEAAADICKYVDAEGRVIYSNTEVQDARRIDCPVLGEPTRKSEPDAPSSRPPAAAPAAPRPRVVTPSSFPRVDSSTQRSRDDLRRRVLNEELASEEKLLATARSQYNNGSPQPLPEEKGSPEKLAERVSRLRQSVQLHERNIQSLRKELSNIR